MRPALPAMLAAMLALSACGSDEAVVTNSSGQRVEPLPVPEGAGRNGVTGMPDAPGPGQPSPSTSDFALDLPPDTPVDSDGNVLPPPDPLGSPRLGSDSSFAPGFPGEPGASPLQEPTPGDAVAVVRDYYAAINGGDYARAYSLWSDGGRASGQSAQQFANGFDRTVSVTVELLEPGRVDAAAGSRYIEVPVAITSTYRSGGERQYVGAYTLRSAVANGATPEQRTWRIASGDIREVLP